MASCHQDSTTRALDATCHGCATSNNREDSTTPIPLHPTRPRGLHLHPMWGLCNPTGTETCRTVPWHYLYGIGYIPEEVQGRKISEEWWRLPGPLHKAADLPYLEAKLIRACVIRVYSNCMCVE